MRVPPRRVLGELTSVRPATGADADLLVRWHRDPEVARYWDNETFTHQQMRARLGRRDVDPYIIEATCEPIGYLQVWFADGLGPDAARALANYLLRETDRTRLTVDPYLSNARAICAWRKAGFRPVEQRPPDRNHTENWLLMTTELTSPE